MGNKLVVKVDDCDVRIPKRHTLKSAGYDFFAPEDIDIAPRSLRKIDTMVRIKLPEGHYGQLLTKSSMAAVGLRVEGGVIDQDYHGPICVYLYNCTDRTIDVKAYSAIAQMVIIPCALPPVVKVDSEVFRQLIDEEEPLRYRYDSPPSNIRSSSRLSYRE